MTFLPCPSGCRMAYDVCSTRSCRHICRLYTDQRKAFRAIWEYLTALEDYKVKTT